MPMCPNCNTFFVQEVKGLAKNPSLHCPFLRWGVSREKGCLEICGDTHFCLDFSTDRGIYVKYRHYAGFVVCRCFILCASGGCGYSLPSEVFLFLDHTIFRAYLFISGSGLGPVATFSLITPILNIGWDPDPGSTAFFEIFSFLFASLFISLHAFSGQITTYVFAIHDPFSAFQIIGSKGLTHVSGSSII